MPHSNAIAVVGTSVLVRQPASQADIEATVVRGDTREARTTAHQRTRSTDMVRAIRGIHRRLLLLLGLPLHTVEVVLRALHAMGVLRRVGIDQLAGVVEALPGMHVACRRLSSCGAGPVVSEGEVHQRSLVGMVPAYAVVADVSGLHLFALELALDALAIRHVADEGKDGSDVLDELRNKNQ